MSFYNGVKESSDNRARNTTLKERVISATIGLGLFAAIAGYLIAPAAWQWGMADSRFERLPSNPNGVIDQVTNIPVPRSNSDLVSELKNAPSSKQGSPIIITYHDIAYGGSEYTITPEAFASQMQLLADAGWNTMTASQLADWVKGKPLPPHTIQITFDDGARGVWKYADPILARNNQHAVAYIITGYVGTHAPYYMTWPELTRLQASGRWDLEAHTHLGHTEIPIDSHGHTGAFLTNLKYLANEHRMETAGEFGARIGRDLAESKSQLVAHGFPEPQLFAYPFSAHAEQPAETAILNRTVNSLFQAAMLDEAGSVATTTTDDVADGNIERTDTTSDVSVRAFAARVLRASPLDPARTSLMNAATWTDPDKGTAKLTGDAGRMTLDPGPGDFGRVALAPNKSALWNSYSMKANVIGFRTANDGATAGLTVLSGDPQSVGVRVAADHFDVIQGSGKDARLLSSGSLPAATGHPVVITVGSGEVVVSLDGIQVVHVALIPKARGHGPAGGIEISAFRRDESSPVPAFSRLSLQ